MELDKTLIRHNEGFWQEPYDPSKTGFSSFNDAGIEIETGEFLYAMTRLLKPDRVLETGTHIGVGMAYMGMALKDNNKGLLDTLEFLQPHYSRAIERREALGLDDVVDCFLTDAALFQPLGTGKYQLILLDTEPQTRFAELIKYNVYLDEGGFVFIHDLHRHMHQINNEEHGFAWPYGKLPEEIKLLVQTGVLRPFHFSTPRGLTGFYKVSKDDYKFFDFEKMSTDAWKYNQLNK